MEKLRFLRRVIGDGEAYESGILIRPRARYLGPRPDESFSD
jgi:hypothetical protein